MTQHVILFLAANPSHSSKRALDDECAAIERALRMASHRNDFAFHSKWAVTVDDMIRHFNELRPTIIHFSGDSAGDGSDGRSGIYLQGDRDAAQLVTGRALRLLIQSAATSARVVVLNACYSEPQAEAVRSVVDCVVGMAGAIGSDAARSFAVSFYGALGNHRSVGNAVDQAVAVLAAKDMPEEVLPRCLARDGIDKYQVILDAVDGPGAGPRQDAAPRPERPPPSPRPPGPVRGTREDVLKALSLLSLPEFDLVVLRSNIPIAHLSGPSAALTTRAIEVIRYMEQRAQLAQLAQLIEDVRDPS